MITIKSHGELDLMRKAGKIVSGTFEALKRSIKPGITTKELDRIAYDFIKSSGATPSFLNYGGFPASACISVNDQVIHGIPNKDVVLKDGDIVKVDVGAFYRGFHGDSANTFAVGNISDEAKRLIDATKQSFWQGVEAITPGGRIGDIGHAIESYVKQFGYSVVRRYVGHGIGHDLHESPEVPNYGTPGRGPRLSTGMVIAIEPMVNIGSPEVLELADGWTVLTADRSLSAHYEHTVAITDNGVEILTLVE